MERLVACRTIALEQGDEEEVKRITRLLKKRARNIRTENKINKLKRWKWDPIKYFKKGYMAKFTNLKNERGELVKDRMRPDTFADCFGQVQWARNNDIDQRRQEAPDVEPICDTEAEVKQDSFTKGELNEAISRLKNNKTPGPNGVTSELIELLDGEARGKLLELLNKCWEEEKLFEEMNQADLAVIYKKGPT